MTIDWTRVGPERPERIELPPVPMRLNGYVMDFDATVGEVVFLTGAGYDGFGEAWSWNGERWKQLHESKLNLDGEGFYQGYYDPVRKGMVAFRFGYDDEQYVPNGMRVTAKGAEPLVVSGELPVGTDGFGDVRGAIGYDRKREVGVCLTPTGVWELDSKGAWSKATALEPGDVPAEWKDACGAVWDPVREVVVFWIYEGDEYTHVFFDWDGKALTPAPTTGLPTEEEGVRAFHIGLFDPSACFCGHPEHGVVLVDGAQLWRFDGKAWSTLPAAESPPPRMQSGHVAYDPTRDALVLGPGYHEGDGGGRELQQVFFEHRNGAWKTLGVKMEDSPVEDLYGKHLYFVCEGTPYVVTLRGLQTYGWKGDAWVEVVDEKTGNSVVGQQHVGAVVGMGDHALAVLTDGSVCRFDGSSWTRTKEAIPDFKERRFFTLTRVGETERLVLWGGDVKNRKSNDSFFRDDDGSWRKHKKASPRPKDFGHEHGPYVDFDTLWDSALQRVLRIGWDECFTLEGEVWKAWEPKDFKEHAGARRSAHLPVHDPVTGETLLVNLHAETVARFDLDRCVGVGTLSLPHDEIGPERQHDTQTWSKLEDDLWYEPATRTLRAQFKEDKWAQYAWDLGPAFEAAAKLGPRTLLESAPEPTPAPAKKASGKKSKKKDAASAADAGETSARLYVIDESSRKLWYCDVEGSHVLRRWGRIDGKQSTKKEKKKSPAQAQEAAAKLIAKKRADGYVDASALSLDAIASLGAVASRGITVGRAKKKVPADLSIDRIGGLPSGVSKKKWPKADDGTPMGFLFQIGTDGILTKHAGVAVFCVTDGTATEDEDLNAVVLLTPSQWTKAPGAAPDVPVLKVRPLKLGKPKLEVLEERVQELAADDPELGARFDELQSSSRVHDETPWSKVGGAPAWVQDGELGDDWVLVAQLDFDGLSLEGAWADAGLFGCVYVVVRKDEKAAAVFWQYT